MKVMYVFTSAGITNGSVQQKVINQIMALNQIGVNCKGLFFSTDEANHLNNTFYEFIKVPKISGGYFRSAKQRIAYQKSVYDYFSNNELDADYIYCRYPGAGKFIAKWVNRIGNKIFFEHLTSETLEIALYSKEHPFKLNLSSILSRIEFLHWPLLNERLYGGSIRFNAKFGIANSNDIALYENKRAGRKYVEIIGGDAVDTSSFEIRPFKKFDGKLKMIFLKGAVTKAEFNGLDRLLKGMAKYTGEHKIHLYLFGKNLQIENELIKELGIQQMVSIGDFLDKEAINTIMQDIDLGIAALGVHRKGLKGTTTIKSREYCARGIPFIYGHNDPDFSTNQLTQIFCKEYPANDSIIDIDELLEWFKTINLNEAIGQQMHQYAQTYLDYTSKMKKIKDYLESNGK